VAPAASLGRRALAGAIDVVIAVLVAVGIALITGGLDPIVDSSAVYTSREISEAYFELFGSTFTAVVVLGAASEITIKVTIGKFISGTRSLDETGAAVSKGRAFMRNLAKFVSVYLFGVGLAWAVIDKRNRTWHDLMTGTYVAKTC